MEATGDVYLSDDPAGGMDKLIMVQLYCPFCWKGNGVTQPELTLRNHGQNPKHIEFKKVEQKWSNEVRTLWLLTVDEPIGCPGCGWRVHIENGAAKDERKWG